MKIVKILALVSALVVAACSNGTMGSVSFSLTARRAASPGPSAAFSSGAPAPAPSVTAAGDSTVIALAPDTVIVRSAQLVLRKVELKRADVASCDAILGNGDCEDFETGSKPMTLHDGQTLNVTLRVDISTWYLNATKTALVDPASANKGGPNESVVANNIQNSFKAFEDDNRDGLEG